MTNLAKWQKKCERRAIEKALRANPRCLVCGDYASTAHHFFPKSISNYLRCDQRNLIPICRACHFAHHTKSDPRIHQKIVKVMGLDWYNNLEKLSRLKIKSNIGYWKDLYGKL